jgi:hypothetical protein
MGEDAVRDVRSENVDATAILLRVIVHHRTMGEVHHHATRGSCRRKDRAPWEFDWVQVFPKKVQLVRKVGEVNPRIAPPTPPAELFMKVQSRHVVGVTPLLPPMVRAPPFDSGAALLENVQRWMVAGVIEMRIAPPPENPGPTAELPERVQSLRVSEPFVFA